MLNDDMLTGLAERFNGTKEIVPQEQRSTRRHGRPPAVRSEKFAETKQMLMERFEISEPVAHRLIQNFAMESRVSIDYISDMIRYGLWTHDHLAADNGNTAK